MGIVPGDPLFSWEWLALWASVACVVAGVFLFVLGSCLVIIGMGGRHGKG